MCVNITAISVMTQNLKGVVHIRIFKQDFGVLCLHLLFDK